ncbi:MAG: tRNA guanosine(34) transglycosylase Tgt [Microthrixaceae bacterium]
MRLTIDVEAVDGAARAGTITTARGVVRTPVFMPVGTRGTVRALRTADLEALGAQIVLGNTYHLMLRPGVDVVESLGGLHRFQDWNGHLLTDSGGYQVFSLGPDVTDDGAEFSSTYDGSRHLLTPESAVAVQERLGADVQMVLDVCSPLPSDRATLRAALERTATWAARAKAAHGRTVEGIVARQALFGIVQGGTETDLRAESARRTVDLDFDGYAIGGLSVGESRAEMTEAIDAAIAELPPERPRYLMGVGDPLGIVEAVARGVDMMDCVLPTRLARHGTILGSEGRFNLRRAEFAASSDPLDPECACEVCIRYPRGYLRHLLAVGEPTAATLLTIHNLAWLLGFVDSVRDAIGSGTLDSLRRVTIERWAN